MKTPDTTSKAVSSALDSVNFNGSFPKRHSTVIAEVLMRLLNGERLSGMDAVFDAHTTRLAAVIHNLIHGHQWDISHKDEVVQTNDGRVTEIRRYYLNPHIIATAMQAGGYEFCDSVTDARANLRRSPQPMPTRPQQAVARNEW